ncbi:nicotinate (nicotinamide) nucleotide adenylyltransferase [uncultured Brachyspira sp.]|uniref:nicotinate (nicotinamide) nucleotide adenylyltransferase n=1 Tax=uncultured Brachyspira sp. TaxID=221953 RepID=UPI0026364D24|nr:nicotinate (nicotinamide) nucleotide adenylyltransferase [uncultured Brachyspira sp.]
MDICIFGGAFDPVHKGHIAIAQSAVKKFRFDKLLFMVSKEPPHKSNHTASFIYRLNMVKLALSGLGDKFGVTDIEARLNDLSYTYNSLSALKEIYSNDNIYFLVGSDIFASIEKWYNYKKLFDLAYFIIGCRPGISFKNMIENVPYDIKKRITNKDKIELFEIDSFNISSSEIRQNIKKYLEYLPSNVAEYIINNNLYNKEV